jgi:hypothetical protein
LLQAKLTAGSAARASELAAPGVPANAAAASNNPRASAVFRRPQAFI